MKDQDPPRQSKECTPNDRERHEREKSEDEARYQHYLDTGQHISNEEMMAWFDRLERKASDALAR